MKRIKDNNHLFWAKMVSEIIVEPAFGGVVLSSHLSKSQYKVILQYQLSS